MSRDRFRAWARGLAGALVAAGLVVVGPAGEARAQGAGLPWLIGQTKTEDDDAPKEKRRRRRAERRRRRDKGAEPSTRRNQRRPSAQDGARAAAPPPPAAAEREARDRTKQVLEGRKKSRVTPGTPSRWSNRGAMVPVAAEVPITQPLPARNVPRPAGVATVGQRLQGGDELISARLAVGYYHLETVGQDVVFRDLDGDGDEELTGDSNNLDLIRARATLSYQRIAESQFGLQIDAEVRPQLAGRADSRPTDVLVNELYLSWGRTDWRKRRTGPSWGFAVGRVAIREAGFAQADGLAARYRIMPELMVGAWGGVTGNPYGFNWRRQRIQEVSADWYTGGAFVSVLLDRFSLNVAGGATIANVSADAQGADRIFAYLDAIYSVTEGLNLLLNGWLDVLPDGQFIQNLDLITAYTPSRSLSFSLALGRFSTVVYAASDGTTFITNDDANRATVGDDPEAIILGEDGQPIAPFDALLLTAVYNSVRLRAGYRVLPELETFVRWTTLIRDTSMTNDTLADIGAEVDFFSVRSLPTVGVRYRNPRVIDASVGFTYVIDEEATANAIVRGGIGRGWRGLYFGADARAFFGDIDGYDGGFDLSYTFPREWIPNGLTLRGAFRYFRENVALFQPGAEDVAPDNRDNGQLIPFQESFFGYAGVIWRY